LCMKRLLAAGYPRIFQICRCFRQNERGNKHLPEFTLLEWYCAGQNYLDMMEQCEDLIKFVARDSGSEDSIIFQGKKIDLNRPWQRMSVRKAFEKFASISVDRALLQNRFDEVMAMEIEPNLGNETPLFLYDYPACKAALARLKPDDPSLAERFELYIGGLELCNAYTELTDSNEQKRRFEEEEICRNLSGKPAYPKAAKFLEALQLMPEASGNAFGIDRLIMLFTDSRQIDSVVAFTPEEL
jgi:lysyl-tRNA synthetase class 2